MSETKEGKESAKETTKGKEEHSTLALNELMKYKGEITKNMEVNQLILNLKNY